MKKSIVSMAVMALMLVSAMCACTEKNPYPGYEKNQYYQFFTQNEGELPQIGDLLEVSICCMVNDSTPVIPNVRNMMKLQESAFAGDINEGLAMMHKGDSASFIVNIDSTFKYLFGQPVLPAEFSSTDVMRFELKVNDFYPEKVFAQNYANDVKARNDERIAKLQSDYPEETAKAAKALAAYMAKNNIVAEPTESGLYYVVTEAGNGEKPEVGKPVSMHYTGKLLDGTVFDSSVERGDPLQFVLGVGQVIPGWDEGVQLMSKGEKGVLYVPYYLAYGEQQRGDKITPFSNLIFEVELVDFETFE
jgi:FKBP-type peptidyl-prolyl cis-trans isomerase